MSVLNLLEEDNIKLLNLDRLKTEFKKSDNPVVERCKTPRSMFLRLSRLNYEKGKPIIPRCMSARSMYIDRLLRLSRLSYEKEKKR